MRRTVNTCIRLSLIGFLFIGTTGLGVTTTNAYADKNFTFAAGNSSPLSVTPFVQPPWPPNVTADDVANTITGADAKMEYSADGGVNWTAYDPANPPVFYGAVTVQVRVIADSSNYIPSGFIKTLTFTPDLSAPPAPRVTADDAANTITGADAKMEYSSDGGVNWTAYDPANPPAFPGAVTVLVRVAGDSSISALPGAETTLTFTPNPPAPAAPAVSADDAANVITGLSTAMEFQVDDGDYVRYDGSNAPDLAGAHTVKVRIAADPGTGTPAGAEMTLGFTPNPPAPAAPAVSADDAANTITGLTAAMEFQVDNGDYVRYDGSNAPDLAGAHTVKVRIAADPGTGTPAGAETTLGFTPNPPAPAAPAVSADDAANTITGLTAAMEFQVDNGDYVRYDGSNAPDLAGAHTVKVRIAADPGTGTPAGAETTLTFSTNVLIPAEPTPAPTSTPEQTAVPTPGPAAPLPSGISTLALTATPAPTSAPTAAPTPAATPDIAGSVATSTINNQSVVTIVVDEQKLEQKLAAEGQNAVISIPVNSASDVVIGELNGRMLQSMEQKQAVLEIKTDKAAYRIPAQQINISSILEQLGQSVAAQNIKIQLEIAAPAVSTVNLIESAAQKDNFSIVVPSVDFIIRAVYGARTIEVTQFDAYVERTIAIPDSVDPNRITTGVVIDPDGTVRQVPTKIVIVSGRYFARINSLTNSAYSVVYHPLEFADVARHWAKTEVNDMGARMVINGSGKGLFNPDQAITRAEFAAVIVRGLGLKLVDGATSFSDVRTTDWYSGVIETLVEYKLIDGFDDGTFRPMETITREQAMKIIAQAMVLTDLKPKLSVIPAADALKSFADGNHAAEWAKGSIVAVLESGIVTGRSSTTLAPKANISRAEAVVIIRRLLEKSDLI